MAVPPDNRVLVIEEDEGDAFLIEELLAETHAGFGVILATSLRQGLSRLDGVVAVLLSLPTADAGDPATAVRILVDGGVEVPIVVLVGYSEEHLGLAAVAAGAADALVKGQFDGETFGRTIRLAIERRTAEDERARLREAERELGRLRGRRRAGRLPDPARSSCLLIGTSRYDDAASYPDLPAVGNNLTALAAVLGDPVSGGFAPDRIHVEHNPAAGAAVGRRLAAIAERTTDVLLVYYGGHGVLDEDGELYYGLPEMEPGDVWCTGLPHRWIRRAMVNSPAAARVLIVDCCFSGRAIEAMSGPESVLDGQLDIGGAYTLTATAGTTVALAPRGAPHTAFTGELLRLLTAGLDDEGPLLHLIALYPPLTRALLARNFPRPQQRGTGTIGDLALTRNAAHAGS